MSRALWPSIDHLVALTDDTGVLQHAALDVPNRNCGYCTDDVARALIVAVEAARYAPTEEVGRRIGAIYLAYLLDAQLDDGCFHNFMGYDRRWQDHAGGEDTFGRALWGLGFCAARAPRASWRTLADGMFARALPRVAELTHLRARAYAALGLAFALEGERRANDAEIRAALETTARGIAAAFEEHAAPGWTWCEAVMSYDNARIPEALLRAGAALGDEPLVALGRRSLAFLGNVTDEHGMFVPVGNDGWYPRGGIKARYGQQPLEAAATVHAALLAQDLTGDDHWRRLAQDAFDWFHGRNTAGATMVVDGGCRDGIDADAVNANMGAESTLSYLMSAIALAQRASGSLRIVR